MILLLFGPFLLLPSQTVSFDDVTSASGLGGFYASAGDPHGPGAVFADLTNDGFPDLYLLRGHEVNDVYVNVDEGAQGRSFIQLVAGGGAADAGAATGATAADYDNDGDLDLYVLNWRSDNVLFRNMWVEDHPDGGGSPLELSFVDVTDLTDPTPEDERDDTQHGLGRATYRNPDPALGRLDVLNHSLTAAWGDIDRDGWLDLFVGNHDGLHDDPALAEDGQLGERDTLYLNNGDGTFSDITMSPPPAWNLATWQSVGGFEYPSGDCCAGERKGANSILTEFSSTNAATFADVNNDGWPDLVVTNKAGEGAVGRDMLYINAGLDPSGRWAGFRLETYLLPDGNDGTIGFGDMTPSDMGIVAGDIDNDGDIDLYTSLREPNAMWFNRLSERGVLSFDFDPVTFAADFAWGVEFQDFDNNGRLDVHTSTNCAARDYLYMQALDGSFVELAVQAGVSQAADSPDSRGNPTADYNRDGWPDLFVVNKLAVCNQVLYFVPSVLYENTSETTNAGHHFLHVKLVGDPLAPTPLKSTRDAIGARVTVTADLDGDNVIESDETILREVTSGSGNAASTCSLALEFGLGLATSARLGVRWPSGRVDELTVGADRFLTLTEGEPVPVAHWRLDEDLRDSVGVHDATLIGPAASFIPAGPVGGALIITGAAVSVPSSAILDQLTIRRRTLSAWFAVNDADDSDKQVIYEQGDETRGINLYVNDGEVFAGAWNLDMSGWQGSWISSSAIQSGVWHHVALVLDGLATIQPDALRLYLDGVLIGSAAGSQLWPQSADVTIGANGGQTQFHDDNDEGAPDHFHGRLDDLRVYNQTLSPGEVQALFEAGNP